MEFKFERIDGLACEEFLYKAIANYFSLDYELAAIDSWSFAFDSTSGVASSNEGCFEENLKLFHGLNIDTTIISDHASLHELIRKIISNNDFCMLHSDLYYIPWSASCYKKRHWGHTVLITQVTSTGYLCYDFYTFTGEILPFDCIPKRVGLSTFSVTIPRRKLNSLLEYKSLLCDTLNKNISNRQVFLQMEYFSKSLNSSFNIHEMTRDSKVFENSIFINSLNRIAQCRFQFALILSYITRLFPEFDLSEIENEMRKCAVSWKSITSLLIKSYVLTDNKKIIEKVSNKVLQVRYLEEEIFTNLLDKLSEPQCMLQPQNKNTVVNSAPFMNPAWKHVDIEQYFNNKAFGDSLNTQGAEYEQGSFLLINSEIQKRFLALNAMEFRLPNYLICKKDNIVCASQELRINEEISEFALLANSEFDHQIDYINLYTPTAQIPIEISATSWQCTPILEDHIMWTGTSGFKYNEQIILDSEERHIFAKIYRLTHRTYVSSLKLPDNPNIHIFGFSYR